MRSELLSHTVVRVSVPLNDPLLLSGGPSPPDFFLCLSFNVRIHKHDRLAGSSLKWSQHASGAAFSS
ncbi:hypothetical protein KSP9073_01355 [Kushneria phyllosphaerae]|uniref:Uncharacterized protein n=1 Tax=Kushneria phyllosphaerae TaxID=2100822 RepID=A0A2R8CKD2_9GAMM|nr:hypothetical protein KSP9073_01355 [Kushneria phyllosphaerae]